jgi:hypothetical protein
VGTRDIATRAIRYPRKIRYTDAEWAAIIAHAHACGRPPARYVREASLGIVPKASRSKANASTIHELGRIGTTLSVLSRQEHTAGEPNRADAIDGAIAELLALVRQLA